MIEFLGAHGGDVLKFAGDALVCCFGSASDDTSLESCVIRAVQCAMEIQKHLGRYEAEGVVLTLHLGIVAGLLSECVMGGTNNMWEFVVAGRPMGELDLCVSSSDKGQVILSADAWQAVEHRCEGEPWDNGVFEVTAVTIPENLNDLKSSAENLNIETIRCFVPSVVQTKVDAGHAEWMNEVRVVTVVFVSLIGMDVKFTKNKTADISRVQAALNEMQSVVCRLDGFVRQFLVDDKGTVLIAAFGVPPCVHEDDAARGLRTAVGIHDGLAALGISCGVGVASGNLFVGSVGSGSRQEYSILGDHVNLSARLMKAAGNGVLVDENTFRAAQASEEFVTPHPAPIKVKGKSQPICVFRPVTNSQRNKNTCSTKSASVLPPIEQHYLPVAQEVTDAVAACMHKASGGGVSLLLIEADAGLGKTVYLRMLANSGCGLRVIAGCCDRLESTFFSSLKSPLRTILGILPSMTLEEQHETVYSFVDSKEGVDEWRPYLSFLNLVLGLQLPVHSLAANKQKGLVLGMTADLCSWLLLQSAAATPSLLLLDNAESLDSQSLLVLTMLVAANANLVIVFAGRPGGTTIESIKALPGLQTVALTPLDNSKMAELLALVQPGLPQEVVDFITSKSGGSPLYAIGMLSVLVSSDALLVEDSTVIVGTPLDQFALGDSLQMMLTARLGLLSPQELLVIKHASALGPEFQLFLLLEFVEKVLCTAEDDLASVLQHLQSMRLLLPSAHGDGYLQFETPLLQEAVYASITEAQRENLHLRAADLYAASDVDNKAATVAHHLTASLPQPLKNVHLGYHQKILFRSLQYGADVIQGMLTNGHFQTAFQRVEQYLDLLDVLVSDENAVCSLEPPPPLSPSQTHQLTVIILPEHVAQEEVDRVRVQLVLAKCQVVCITMLTLGAMPALPAIIMKAIEQITEAEQLALKLGMHSEMVQCLTSNLVLSFWGGMHYDVLKDDSPLIPYMEREGVRNVPMILRALQYFKDYPEVENMHLQGLRQACWMLLTHNGDYRGAEEHVDWNKAHSELSFASSVSAYPCEAGVCGLTFRCVLKSHIRMDTNPRTLLQAAFSRASVVWGVKLKGYSAFSSAAIPFLLDDLHMLERHAGFMLAASAPQQNGSYNGIEMPLGMYGGMFNMYIDVMRTQNSDSLTGLLGMHTMFMQMSFGPKSFLQCLIMRAYVRLGRSEDALEYFKSSQQEGTDGLLWSEKQRLAGEVMFSLTKDKTASLARLSVAYNAALQQGSRWVALRTALSMAHVHECCYDTDAAAAIVKEAMEGLVPNAHFPEFAKAKQYL